jgi:broad specificity phosphatase PhoE
MKIYILRHEERTNDCTFFSPLTKDGLNNSVKLVNYLKRLNITDIYCSPFIRTLQTINPFVLTNPNKYKVKLEYGLIEIKHPDIIPPKSHNVELPVHLADIFNYDPEYDSFIDTNKIPYPENDNDLELRIKKFLRYLIKENSKTNKNILLVTHQGICSNILKIVGKYMPVINEVPYGSLSLVADTDTDKFWTFQKIL